jgi:alpha-D-ribose 1-methylphosphonate 5-triphosphate diphosphatase
LSAEKAALLADIRVQIRLETHVTKAFCEVEQAVARHGVDYVVFNDHLPEAVQMADTQPARFAQCWPSCGPHRPLALRFLGL